MMKGGIGNLMRQAQQMQENMQKAQADLASLEKIGAGNTDPGFVEELADLEVPEDEVS